MLISMLVFLYGYCIKFLTVFLKAQFQSLFPSTILILELVWRKVSILTSEPGVIHRTLVIPHCPAFNSALPALRPPPLTDFKISAFVGRLLFFGRNDDECLFFCCFLWLYKNYHPFEYHPFYHFF